MARVRYSPRIARCLAEREEGEWDPEGGFTVRHRILDPHWLVRPVLQYGPDAEVLEPEEARRWGRKGIAGMAAPRGRFPPRGKNSVDYANPRAYGSPIAHIARATAQSRKGTPAVRPVRKA